MEINFELGPVSDRCVSRITSQAFFAIVNQRNKRFFFFFIDFLIQILPDPVRRRCCWMIVYYCPVHFNVKKIKTQVETGLKAVL